MATIVNAHNLSTGQVLSSEITNANNVRIQYLISGATDIRQIVDVEFLVSDDGGSNYESLTDMAERPIVMTLVGNSHGSRNVVGINSAKMKLKVVPRDTCVGTITINTYES